MKLIHYAGETLLTGDAIADALLSYASALASRGEAATIVIPVRLSDGSIGEANLLVGPASQLVAVPRESALEEIVDNDLLARIEARIVLLSHGHAQAETDTTGNIDNTGAGIPNDWEL